MGATTPIFCISSVGVVHLPCFKLYQNLFPGIDNSVRLIRNAIGMLCVLMEWYVPASYSAYFFHISTAFAAINV